MTDDDFMIPDFLRLSDAQRAAAWERFQANRPLSSVTPPPSLSRPKRPKVPKTPLPPKMTKSQPKVDRTGQRWDGVKGRWMPESPLATVGAVLINQPVPTATRSCIELEAPIRVVKRNPRVPGTGAFVRFEAMFNFIMTHPNATVGDVLTQTVYRKDDYAWDLRKGNVK